IDLDVLVSQSTRRVISCHHWAAKRPATSEREIKAQSQFARFLRSESQSINEPVREKRQGLDSLLRIVQHQRINRLYFKAADAAFFHRPHLTLEFSFVYRRSEPPPAHHDARVVGRTHE